MVELLFLFGFCLHNLEEALLMPLWADGSSRYRRKIGKGGFLFGLMVVSSLGVLLTFLNLVAGSSLAAIRYLYLGFVGTMVLNALIPHLLATLAERRYAPGTGTGMLLNVPMGLWLLLGPYRALTKPFLLILWVVLFSLTLLALLNPLFRLGEKMLRGLYSSGEGP